MARKRKKHGSPQTAREPKVTQETPTAVMEQVPKRTETEYVNTIVDVAPVTPVTQINSNNKRKVGKQMAGLTPEQIRGLLASSRTKGEYSEYLGEFLESGDAGVCANEEWVSLKDRKDTTIKQGFENAKNSKTAPEGADNVKVLRNDDKVYLINLVVAGMGADEVQDDDDNVAIGAGVEE